MTGTPSFDVVIAGAGIIGCASARALSDAGLSVAVIDRKEPGREASSAAAGLLAPQYEAEGPGPMFDLTDRGRALFPDFADALHEETGIDVELRRDGTLLLALGDDDDAALQKRFDWQRQRGLRVERLDGHRIGELEPAASSAARWALHLPHDMQVDNVKVCNALSRALVERGVHRLIGRPVVSVESGSGRVTGVKLGPEGAVRADRVVIAAGAWSGEIAGLPRPLPVAPVRGQIAELRARGSSIRRTLASPRGYVVPRLDGRLLTGSTVEDAGFADHTTAGGVSRILAHALEIAPALADAPLTSVWSGLRPATPDRLPIIGEDPEIAGLIYATGHYRNGILLAPITAQIVTELAIGETPRPDLGAFAPDRFASPSSRSSHAG